MVGNGVPTLLSVLRKMRRIRGIVLTNNRAYIASAGQSDASRTKPRFKLQGSPDAGTLALAAAEVGDYAAGFEVDELPSAGFEPFHGGEDGVHPGRVVAATERCRDGGGVET